MNQMVIKNEKSVRIFVSYSSKDSKIAGKIKYYLQTYFSLEVFLAHEDLEGGEEWADAIVENLRATDFFIPLLSANFKVSEFTDQEVGIAYVLGKRIIPVSIEKGFIPGGFIKKIHAVKLQIETDGYYEWMQFIEKIIAIISKDPHYGQNIRNLIIRAFSKSDTFEVSNNLIGILKRYEPFNAGEISLFIRALCKNSTNWNERYNIPFYMSKFVEKYRDKIDSLDKKELESYFSFKSLGSV